jgi:DNA-binding GntR family transcriptional regulator
MNAGATAERVYDALKRRVLEAGLRPGARLDPTALAEELSASATPVRDALHRLTGERLVETRPSDGFHMPVASEPALQDLYAWNAQIVSLALQRGGYGAPSGTTAAMRANGAQSVVARTAALFEAVARRSGNAEHTAAVAANNDRLHAVRLVEPQVLDALPEELDALAALAAQDGGAALRKALTAYHRRRQRAASALVRALYRHD